MKLYLFTGLVVILSGCAFYPKQVQMYDEECDVYFKKLILKRNDSNMQLRDCKNEACIASLLSIPMQALVAGSVVVAGNTVYWLEKEGKCLLKDDKSS